MIVFSLASLIISFLIYFGVSFIVLSLQPTNIFYAQILILLVGTAITSLIFTMRQFRYLGRERWHSRAFHNTLMRTFVINFIILFVITRFI